MKMTQVTGSMCMGVFTLTLKDLAQQHGLLMAYPDLVRMLDQYSESPIPGHGEFDAPTRDDRMSDLQWHDRQVLIDPRHVAFSLDIANQRQMNFSTGVRITARLTSRGPKGKAMMTMVQEGTPFTVRPRIVAHADGDYRIVAWDLVDA